MQEKTTQARPYAIAAFEQAQDEGKLSDWSNMLQLLSLIVSDSQMQLVMENPKMGVQSVYRFVLDICGNNLSATGKNFVKVLIDAGRLSLAPQIYQLFEKNRTAIEGIIEVEVVSAYSVESEEQQKIADVMGKNLGKKIEISTQVDKSLIGGVIIRTGDSVIDASIKGRLKQLGNVLAE